MIALFIVNVAIIFSKGNVIDSVVKSSKDVYRPSQDAIKDFILLVTRSKMLVTNWVYLQTNVEDKNALRTLQDYDYPALKDKITRLMPTWESDSQRMDGYCVPEVPILYRCAEEVDYGQPSVVRRTTARSVDQASCRRRY